MKIKTANTSYPVRKNTMPTKKTATPPAVEKDDKTWPIYNVNEKDMMLQTQVKGYRGFFGVRRKYLPSPLGYLQVEELPNAREVDMSTFRLWDPVDEIKSLQGKSNATTHDIQGYEVLMDGCLHWTVSGSVAEVHTNAFDKTLLTLELAFEDAAALQRLATVFPYDANETKLGTDKFQEEFEAQLWVNNDQVQIKLDLDTSKKQYVSTWVEIAPSQFAELTAQNMQDLLPLRKAVTVQCSLRMWWSAQAKYGFSMTAHQIFLNA